MKYQAPFGAVDPDASYVDDNEALEIDGSIPPAKAIEDPQRELNHLISFTELVPSDGDLTQVRQAIEIMIGNANLSGIDIVARQRIAILAFNRAADENLTAYSLIDDLYDAFEDGAGIDFVASSNVTLDTGYITNDPGSFTVDLTPQAAAYAASSEESGSVAADAVDDTLGTQWNSTNGATNEWWRADFGAGNEKDIRRVTLHAETGSNQTQGFDLQYSDDAAAWTTLESFAPANNGNRQIFDVVAASPGVKRYWRTFSTANVYGGGGFKWQVRELEMMELGGLSAAQYRSIAKEIEGSEPAGGHLIFTLEDVDTAGGVAALLGAGIDGFLSKNNGATYEPVTLSVLEKVGDLYTIGGQIATMAATGDQTMRMGINLPGTNAYRIYAAGLQA